MMKTIKVTGRGRMKIQPDLMRLLLTVSDTKKSYDAALLQSSEMTAGLQELFEKLGFEKKELKTLRFDVDASYEGYTDKNGMWKQRFKGYSFTHLMKLEFPVDNERLGRILSALAGSGVRAEFRIQHTVRDVEACRNELLGKAVADARAKAEVIASAAGVTLGAIAGIDYSFGTFEIQSEAVNLRSMKMAAEEDCAMGNGSINITADDIDVDDNVTVVWEIS